MDYDINMDDVADGFAPPTATIGDGTVRSVSGGVTCISSACLLTFNVNRTSHKPL